MEKIFTWKYVKGESIALRGQSVREGLRVIVSIGFIILALGVLFVLQDPVFLWFLSPLAIAFVLAIVAFRRRGTSVEATYTFSPAGVTIVQGSHESTVPLDRIRWYSLYADNSLALVKPETARKISAATQAEGKLPLTAIYLKLRGQIWSDPIYANPDVHGQATAWLEAHGIPHSSSMFGKLKPGGKYVRLLFYTFLGLFTLLCFFMAIFFQE